MKKIFTLCIAALASLSMNAVTFKAAEFADTTVVTKNGITVKLADGVEVSEQQIWKDGKTSMKDTAMVIGSSANQDWTVHYVEISSATPLNGVSIIAVNNQSSGTYNVPAVYWKAEAAAEIDGYDLIALENKAGTSAPTAIDLSPIAGTKTIRLYRTIRLNATYDTFSGASGYQTIGDGKTMFITEIEVATCSAPATPLALDADKKADITVGDVITFSTTGGNGADVKFYDGAIEIANPWTATLGSHSITAVQDDKDGFCGATTAALALNVISHDPVTAATVSAPKTEIVIGETVTLNCEATNADAFQWYKDGAAVTGATENTYSYTADAVGSAVFYCTATNAYTTTPVQSNSLTIKATTLCGELIKATHTGDKTADVTGVVGGTADKKTASNAKFGGKGQYFGITLAAGTFKEGDELNVHTSTAAQQGTIAIYAEKEGTTLLYDTEDMGVLGDNIIELPAAVDGTSTIYICRTETNTWNGYVDYISVTRPCEEGEASLTVTPASVVLRATATAPNASAKVTFKGSRLQAGTYNLVVPSVEGLVVSPTSVTVGASGKLNAEVSLSYSNSAEIETATAELNLAIDTLSAKVTITYSATSQKAYGKSIDFEQLVLDNGKNYDVKPALDLANIDYENIDALDSLDSSKDNNNEPYLGLKMKKSGAYLGFWVKAGNEVRIKFGNVSDPMMIDTEVAAADLTSQTYTIAAASYDDYIQIRATSDKTVVIKKIIIGADEPKNNDATIKSLTVNGATVTAQANVYAYEVPALNAPTSVVVNYELNDSKATATPASGFSIAVPAQGEEANTQEITVTAEDGITVAKYTVSVTAQPTEAINNVDASSKAVKQLRNGQLLIIRGDKTYTVTGMEIK